MSKTNRTIRCKMKTLLFSPILLIALVNPTIQLAIRYRPHESEEHIDQKLIKKWGKYTAKHTSDHPQPEGGNDHSQKKVRGDASSRQRIEKFLKEYGYTWNLRRKLSRRAYDRAIRRFATFHRAIMGKRFFKAHGKTIMKRVLRRASNRRRCGNPDMGQGHFRASRVQNMRKKRYVAQTPWSKKNLTYKIEIFGEDLSHEVQRQEFEKAFKMWTDAAGDLSITEVVGSATADINIRFVRGTHAGDSQPFDGPGLIVAHALYPEVGSIHFDEDDTFTITGGSNTVKLLPVAVHEIGHALGMGHSSDTSSVMIPQYQLNSQNLALSQDDINGIQYLYPSSTSECKDEYWCEDILLNECSLFASHCKKKCGKCS